MGGDPSNICEKGRFASVASEAMSWLVVDDEKGPSSGAKCMRNRTRTGNLLESSSSLLPIRRRLLCACDLLANVCVLSLMHISLGAAA